MHKRTLTKLYVLPLQQCNINRKKNNRKEEKSINHLIPLNINYFVDVHSFVLASVYTIVSTWKEASSNLKRKAWILLYVSGLRSWPTHPLPRFCEIRNTPSRSVKWAKDIVSVLISVKYL